MKQFSVGIHFLSLSLFPLLVKNGFLLHKIAFIKKIIMLNKVIIINPANRLGLAFLAHHFVAGIFALYPIVKIS